MRRMKVSRRKQTLIFTVDVFNSPDRRPKIKFRVGEVRFRKTFWGGWVLREFRNFEFSTKRAFEVHLGNTDPGLFVLGLSVLALAMTRGLISLVKA